MTDQTPGVRTVPDKFGPRLLDAKQVSEMLGVSEAWVRGHSGTNAKQPRLPSMKLGAGRTALVRYHLDDVLEFIAEQRRQAKVTAHEARWRN
jgi:hypothetical protein